MIEYLIKTKNLSFSYSKKNKVLNNVNINVPKGSIYGFLGPNGAGKSTTMQLLTEILPNEEGEILIFDKPLDTQTPSIFSRIGALVETPSLYRHLSGIDNLRIITKLKNVDESKIPEVLELVDLSKNRHQKVKQYSLGMRQRLAIAMTLLGEPELLFLDEPVNGLDPVGIKEIRKLLIKLNKEKGITIFISSHLLGEIEKMCTHIGVIDKGNLLFEGTMEELNLKNKNSVIQIVTDNTEQHLDKLKATYPNIEVYDKTTFSVVLKNREEIPFLFKFIAENNIPLYELKSTNDLENQFLSLTS